MAASTQGSVRGRVALGLVVLFAVSFLSVALGSPARAYTLLSQGLCDNSYTDAAYSTFTKAKGCDGDTATNWTAYDAGSNANNPVGEKYFAIDFGEATVVSAARLYTGTSGGKTMMTGYPKLQQQTGAGWEDVTPNPFAAGTGTSGWDSGIVDLTDVLGATRYRAVLRTSAYTPEVKEFQLYGTPPSTLGPSFVYATTCVSDMGAALCDDATIGTADEGWTFEAGTAWIGYSLSDEAGSVSTTTTFGYYQGFGFTTVWAQTFDPTVVTFSQVFTAGISSGRTYYLVATNASGTASLPVVFAADGTVNVGYAAPVPTPSVNPFPSGFPTPAPTSGELPVGDFTTPVVSLWDALNRKEPFHLMGLGIQTIGTIILDVEAATENTGECPITVSVPFVVPTAWSSTGSMTSWGVSTWAATADASIHETGAAPGTYWDGTMFVDPCSALYGDGVGDPPPANGLGETELWQDLRTWVGGALYGLYAWQLLQRFQPRATMSA